MVRCNVPCCNDEWCMPPYPGQPGYGGVVSATYYKRLKGKERVKEERRQQAGKDLENRADGPVVKHQAFNPLYSLL